MAPKGRLPRRDRRRPVRAVGMGSHLLDARPFCSGPTISMSARPAPSPAIFTCGAVRSRPLPPRGSCRDRFMADPRRVVWLLAAGIAVDHHTLDDRLLDALAVGLQADVLHFHSRHLLLHRSLFRAAQQSRALPHAQHVHRDLPAGREYFEFDRGPVGGRVVERLVRRRSCDRCGLAAPRAALLGADADFGRLIICILPRRTIVADQKRAIGYTNSWSP